MHKIWILDHPSKQVMVMKIKGCNFFWNTHTSYALLFWNVGIIAIALPSWHKISFFLSFFLFFGNCGCPGQPIRTLTNPPMPKVNDHVNFQWPWNLWHSNWWLLGSKLKTWPIKLYSSGWFLSFFVMLCDFKGDTVVTNSYRV